MMRFTSTRKAIKDVHSGNLKSDLKTLVWGHEKVARDNTKMAGARTHHLIGTLVGLRKTLPAKTRLSIVNAVFADAAKAELPHQWEKKEGFECGRKNDCGKENPDKTCYRDTWTGSCISG